MKPDIEMCDNCTEDRKRPREEHRCRANADSCIDGTNCEDYIATCACEICA